LGMLAPRTNAAGQQMPNVLGQYPAAKDGQPGYTPPGAASLLPPGIAPSDTVPAMLAPNEVVVPAGDAALLQNMGSFSEGGKVGGNGGGFGGHGGPVPRTPAAPPKASATPGGGRAAPAPGMPGGPPITPLAPPGAPGGIGGPGGPPGGKLPGPGPTSTRDTEQRGITQGEGLPASAGIGIGGGLIGAAESAGPGAAGMGGAAASAGAQIGIDELNRAIGMGAQAAGIGVEGLMQTFMPVESELGDPMRGWFGKALGAVAGIRPAAKNVAGGLTDKILGKGPDKGQQAALTSEQVAAQKAGDTSNSATDNSVTQNIDYHATPDASQSANFTAFSNHLQSQNAMPGGR
jgi:hypothetical protein